MPNNITLQDALVNAVASVELEGYMVSNRQKEIGMKFLNGNITKEDFIKLLLKYYNEKRIKAKLGWMSPVEYRLNLLAA